MVLFTSTMRRWPIASVSASASASAFAMLLASAAHAQTAAPLESAFERYKPYTDEPIANWKAANDNAARIGGWREYARQAQELDKKPEDAPTPVPKAQASLPEPSKKAKP